MRITTDFVVVTFHNTRGVCHSVVDCAFVMSLIISVHSCDTH